MNEQDKPNLSRIAAEIFLRQVSGLPCGALTGQSAIDLLIKFRNQERLPILVNGLIILTNKYLQENPDSTLHDAFKAELLRTSSEVTADNYQHLIEYEIASLLDRCSKSSK